MLKPIEKFLQRHDLSYTTRWAVSNAGQEIVKVAKKEKATMIMMGTHGHGILGRAPGQRRAERDHRVRHPGPGEVIPALRQGRRAKTRRHACPRGAGGCAALLRAGPAGPPDSSGSPYSRGPETEG